jgi:hypothetical protein
VGCAAIATVALVLVSWVVRGLPEARSSSAPPAAFSAERALEHLRAIARTPRAPGGEGHRAARSYLAAQLGALGYTVAIEEDSIVEREGDSLVSARIFNVVARSGVAAGRPIVVVCHYDSVPTSAGVSDNGIAVAAMIEVARALSAAPVQKPLTLLFTDAEEIGSFGAASFLRKARTQPLAVFNFDARGTRGPSLMFELSQPSGALVDLVGDALARPRASSLAAEVYRRMPNDTDFTRFRRAGIPGANFAHIERLDGYHSALDDLVHVSPETVQHVGDNMLALVRAAAEMPEAEAHESSVVYFDLFGRVLVSYSGIAAIVFALLACLALAAMIRRERLSLGRLARAAGALAGLAIASVAAAWLLWFALGLVIDLPLVHEEPPDADLFFAAFACATLAAFLLGLELLRTRFDAAVLGAAALAITALVLLAVVWFAVGASYLLQWPLAAGVAMLGVSRYRRVRLGVVAVGALPVLALLVPVIRDALTALTLNALPELLAVVALGIVTAVPVLTGLGTYTKRAALALAVLAIAVLAVVVVRAGYSEDWREPGSVVYGVDADKGTAHWIASTGARGWSRQSLGPDAKEQAMPAFFPAQRRYLTADARLVALSGPELQVIRAERSVVVNIVPSRPDAVLELSVDPPDGAVFEKVDRVELTGDAQNTSRLRAWAAPATGLEVVLRSKGSATLRAVEIVYGLPDAIRKMLPERPATSMPVPLGFGLTDATRVSRSVALPAAL